MSEPRCFDCGITQPLTAILCGSGVGPAIRHYCPACAPQIMPSFDPAPADTDETLNAQYAAYEPLEPSAPPAALPPIPDGHPHAHALTAIQYRVGVALRAASFTGPTLRADNLDVARRLAASYAALLASPSVVADAPRLPPLEQRADVGDLQHFADDLQRLGADRLEVGAGEPVRGGQADPPVARLVEGVRGHAPLLENGADTESHAAQYSYSHNLTIFPQCGNMSAPQQEPGMTSIADLPTDLPPFAPDHPYALGLELFADMIRVHEREARRRADDGWHRGRATAYRAGYLALLEAQPPASRAARPTSETTLRTLLALITSRGPVVLWESSAGELCGTFGRVPDESEHGFPAGETLPDLVRALAAAPPSVVADAGAGDAVTLGRETFHRRDGRWYHDDEHERRVSAGTLFAQPALDEIARLMAAGIQLLAEVARLTSALDAATRRAEAWAEYAQHAEGCVDCCEMSWESCFEGRSLRAAATALDP